MTYPLFIYAYGIIVRASARLFRKFAGFFASVDKSLWRNSIKIVMMMYRIFLVRHRCRWVLLSFHAFVRPSVQLFLRLAFDIEGRSFGIKVYMFGMLMYPDGSDPLFIEAYGYFCPSVADRDRWISRTKASDAEFWCFLSISFPLHPLWRHSNLSIYSIGTQCCIGDMPIRKT